MKTLPAILLLSTALGMALPPPLAAQTTPPGSASAPATPGAQPPTPEPATQEARQASRAADRAALFEARLAAMHAGLTLTPEQEALWPAVDRAIRGYAKMRDARRDRRIDAEQDREDAASEAGRDADPIAALKVYSESLMERAQAFKALSDAVDPLYAALGDDQKNRIPLLLRDIAPKRGPLTKLAERFEDDAPGAHDNHEARSPRAEPFGPDGRAEGDRRWREGRRDWGQGGRSFYRDRSDEDGGRTMIHRGDPDAPAMNDDEPDGGDAD